MDTLPSVDPNSTVEKSIRSLEYDRAVIERRFERPDEFLDMVDWGAMTEQERDSALYDLPDNLRCDLWSIECRLDAVIRSQCSYF